jgi:CheY-like chemotaxis protein/HPt (histidine-containing phosphotransfer) domain-containing protein
LIVEDNIVNQKLAVRMVEKLGYRPDVVENGREALTALRAGTYAAVLMDCQMPVMDGFEATRQIRDREARLEHGPPPEGLSVVRDDGSVPHIPIIAVTANAMEGDRERCLAAGMDDYLAKPVKLEELRGILQRWIATERPRHAGPSAEQRLPQRTEQAVFDAEKMWHQIGGDDELFVQLVALFLERHEEALTGIQTAFLRGDALALERMAHTLKGTAGNMCAAGVALAASRLEAVGHLAKLEDAPSLYSQLELEVQHVVRVLTRYRDGYRSHGEPAA